jgi:hypothetical protein
MQHRGHWRLAVLHISGSNRDRLVEYKLLVNGERPDSEIWAVKTQHAISGPVCLLVYLQPASWTKSTSRLIKNFRPGKFKVATSNINLLTSSPIGSGFRSAYASHSDKHASWSCAKLVLYNNDRLGDGTSSESRVNKGNQGTVTYLPAHLWLIGVFATVMPRFKISPLPEMYQTAYYTHQGPEYGWSFRQCPGQVRTRTHNPYKSPMTRHLITFTSPYTPTQRLHLNASPAMDDHGSHLSGIMVEESWYELRTSAYKSIMCLTSQPFWC